MVFKGEVTEREEDVVAGGDAHGPRALAVDGVVAWVTGAVDGTVIRASQVAAAH